MDSKNSHWKVDLALAIIASIIWLWFAYQYGFTNSPDSFYRGILAKSIIEGHPYFINIKQGFLYDYPVYHHNAAHEPLLPLLYAIAFLFTGPKIIIANLISSVSAGLLLFPLLQLSRKLVGTWIPGVAVYSALVFNTENGFLFEVTNGLSLPTFILLLAGFLALLYKTLVSNKQRWLVMTSLCLAGFYLTRSEAQPLFFWVWLWTSILGYFLLGREVFIRLEKMWVLSIILVLPWIIRKIVLFGSPFFSHMTPILWVDDAYDYWRYPVDGVFPTSELYFSTHSINDFLGKIIDGIAFFFTRFNDVVPGPFYVYFTLLLLAFIALLYYTRGERRFIFITILVIVSGICGLLMLVPILDDRYFIPLLCLMFFTIAAGILVVYENNQQYLGFIPLAAVLVAILGASYLQQAHFWQDFGRHIRFSYTTSDDRLKSDLLIKALRERFPDGDNLSGAILGPFADVQRLSFATGLPFVEIPTNLEGLENPLEFLKKYNTQYSLANISRALPIGVEYGKEPIGNQVLYLLNKEDNSVATVKEVLTSGDLQATIQEGVREKRIYIDSRLSLTKTPDRIFNALGAKLRVYNRSVADDTTDLYKSGVVLLMYRGDMPTLAAEEVEAFHTFLANGGRMLVLCPAWVWIDYQKKGLKTLPYNQILDYFDIILGSNYVNPPFIVRDAIIGNEAILDLSGVVPSEIIYGNNSTPLISGDGGNVFAVKSRKGKGKAIVWGHDYLLKDEYVNTPEGEETLTAVIDWLLAID